MQEGEIGTAGAILRNRLPIDDGGLTGQAGCGGHDAAIAIRPVMTAAGESTCADTVDQEKSAESVVLNLVDPVLARWRLVDQRRCKRWDEGK